MTYLHKPDMLAGATNLSSPKTRKQAVQFQRHNLSRFPNFIDNRVKQLHHNRRLDDKLEAKAHIYAVYEKDSGDIVYVGQTCDGVGVKKRFEQHLDSVYHPDWSTSTHGIKTLWSSVMTQFETTTSEQYYIDANGGIGSLENEINALTASTFDKYVNGDGNPRWGKKWRPKN
mgnify:FL=1